MVFIHARRIPHVCSEFRNHHAVDDQDFGGIRRTNGSQNLNCLGVGVIVAVEIRYQLGEHGKTKKRRSHHVLQYEHGSLERFWLWLETIMGQELNLPFFDPILHVWTRNLVCELDDWF